MDESAAAAAEKVQGLGEVLGCVLGLTARVPKHSTERKVKQSNAARMDEKEKKIRQWRASNLSQSMVLGFFLISGQVH